jgi:NAD(P)-dependent dehydrogenase (short-subunit alcohol dehydrogenase family)
MAPGKTLLVVGSGPGIGRAVATLFASKGYSNVVLVARRTESLAQEKAALEQTVGAQAKINTYTVDITDSTALTKALDSADAAFGKPDCVFFNAARVLPSALFEHDVKDIEYDFKVRGPSPTSHPSFPDATPRRTWLTAPAQINVSALYVVAQRYMPHLVALAKADAAAKPALLVTSSALPMHPIPQLFALSLVKAAQRNMVQSLNMTYAPEGVHVGVINVQGPVSPEDPDRSPTIIAAKTWEWFQVGKEFEVAI